jgi:hypothetical protein
MASSISFRPGQLRSYISLSDDERENIIQHIEKEFSLLSAEARESIIRELKIKKEIDDFEDRIACKQYYASIDNFKDLLMVTCGLDSLINIHTTLLIEEQLCDSKYK